MKLKVLIIEDEKPLSELLTQAIREKLENLGHEPVFDHCSNISQSVEPLRSIRPHFVTLDLRDDTTLDATAGKPAWNLIRDEHFCPVVFYSANQLPEGFPDGTDPFARYLNKGSKEPKDVAATIEEFVPHVLGLEQIRTEVEGRYAKSLQKVSSLIWKAETDPVVRNQSLLRVTRRRLAATLEGPLGDETHIKAWEQFIYPPIDDHLCTGDVIFRRGGNRTTAEDFRVVLTPPCDLVTGEGRHPVNDILVGKCISVSHQEILRIFSLQRDDKLPGRLATRLKGDRLEGKLILPRLVDLWPAMVLDFKALEVVSRASVALSSESANPESHFERVASMDSPFSEALSWRFTHTVGRPGYPEVDEEALGADIQAAAAAS